MKEIIALIYGVSVTIATIYFHAKGKIAKVSASVFFAAAIIGGLAIANYDVVKKFKGFGVEVETARNEISSAKTQALSEIQKQVAKHKESIAMLIRTGNELSEKLGKQKTIVNAMIEKAKSIEEKLQKDEKKIENMKAGVTLAHRNTQAIFKATKELSVILTRITYLQVQTKHEFGDTTRLKKAAEIIEKDLNRILQLMIPDLIERKAFVSDLKNALPAR